MPAQTTQLVPLATCAFPFQADGAGRLMRGRTRLRRADRFEALPRRASDQHVAAGFFHTRRCARPGRGSCPWRKSPRESRCPARDDDRSWRSRDLQTADLSSAPARLGRRCAYSLPRPWSSASICDRFIGGPRVWPAKMRSACCVNRLQWNRVGSSDAPAVFILGSCIRNFTEGQRAILNAGKRPGPHSVCTSLKSRARDNLVLDVPNPGRSWWFRERADRAMQALLSGWHNTVNCTPVRPFFICTGMRYTSQAPASKQDFADVGDQLRVGVVDHCFQDRDLPGSRMLCSLLRQRANAAGLAGPGASRRPAP